MYMITNRKKHTHKHVQKNIHAPQLIIHIAIHEDAKEADATRDCNR